MVQLQILVSYLINNISLSIFLYLIKNISFSIEMKHHLSPRCSPNNLEVIEDEEKEREGEEREGGRRILYWRRWLD
jgi:hypothetical protein